MHANNIEVQELLLYYDVAIMITRFTVRTYIRTYIIHFIGSLVLRKYLRTVRTYMYVNMYVIPLPIYILS